LAGETLLADAMEVAGEDMTEVLRGESPSERAEVELGGEGENSD
jgi:hypothetical protein